MPRSPGLAWRGGHPKQDSLTHRPYGAWVVPAADVRYSARSFLKRQEAATMKPFIIGTPDADGPACPTCIICGTDERSF